MGKIKESVPCGMCMTSVEFDGLEPSKHCPNCNWRVYRMSFDRQKKESKLKNVFSPRDRLPGDVNTIPCRRIGSGMECEACEMPRNFTVVTPDEIEHDFKAGWWLIKRPPVKAKPDPAESFAFDGPAIHTQTFDAVSPKEFERRWLKW